MANRKQNTATKTAPQAKALDLNVLSELEKKVLWLASWMIHNANHIRPSRDGVKVGGHQASSASMVTIMTALYFHVLKAEDKVAVKPHASPVFHAIQYLLGNQSLEQLENFRSFGGAQSYPSRTKDKDDVDFSTGSVGLGVAATLFSSIAQDYLFDHGLVDSEQRKGKMIALLGDAELDEGNIYEALLEGWKKDLKNTWWIVDYNRQSLDGVINDELFQRIQDFFNSVGWRVVTLKYGKKMQKAFEGPAGNALKKWIDECPNQLYSALTFKGGDAWRARLEQDLKGTKGLTQFLKSHTDEQLQALMTNLGGHDLEYLIEEFEKNTDETPVCFIAYTVKGWGLPLAGHKDNHSGQMTAPQIQQFKEQLNIAEGNEWDKFAGMSISEKEIETYFADVEFLQRKKFDAVNDVLPVTDLKVPSGAKVSTQVVFGKLMQELSSSKDELANRVVTTSPDVASSTNLSAWLNKRGVYHTNDKQDTFKDEKVPSPIKWVQSPSGQHIELGIAESNLFTILASLGLTASHFGCKLIPVGTLYDPFICRGLDALNYACYQDARFILAATPSGIALAPEGGAHQSFNTPMIAMAQDKLTYFEPAFADELTVLMNYSLDFVQQAYGHSIYFRLSTRAIDQQPREMSAELKQGIIDGGYWLRKPADDASIIIAYTGVVAPEAIAAFDELVKDIPGAGLLAITSADRLYNQWQQNIREHAAQPSVVESLLAPLSPHATIVSVCDSHPATLSWLGSVHGHRAQSLGVTKFGQSGDIPDLFSHYQIDAEAILNACARAYLK
ncbi:1-deoxy-D-xylulose-5-phosphate synthase N-terminal domain-containing protein [Aliikangiella maris]|uniref:1-deoxy-D-xylulose-5-phosphate synthase N-terminal domain-containing protein n=2 Tax=Aliikangiella maris TaxID=3162458 RepID=A0ABV2BVT3_9GAMM